MTFEAWLTIGIIIICFALLAFSRLAADVVLMGGLTILLLFGVITPEQALSGLANEGMVTVAVLFIISAGLKETGAINWISDSLLGRPKNEADAQLRIMAPVAFLSAFLNNTPVVAIMIPVITDWARKYQLALSKLLIPLSYAAIIGGTCTLIGTSTNLIINGLIIKETNSTGLGLFELSWIGVPCAILTFIYVLVTGRWLLPKRKSAINQFIDVRQYTIEMIVEADSPLEGKTIEEAGLRQLEGLYLIEIERRNNILPAVSPYERLEGGDRLVFAGIVESVVELQKIRGLLPATNQVFKLDTERPDRCFIEAVVSDTSPLVGKSIKEGKFRTVYNAAIVAVSRNGEQLLREKVGSIILKPGDTLFLEAARSFYDQHHNSKDFFLLSRLKGTVQPRYDRAALALIILALMVILVTTGVMSMLKASMLAAGLMIMGRCLSTNTARRSVDWKVLVVIAASFGIGQALFVSGAADQLANLMISMADDKPIMALAITYFVAATLTAMITNNAAAVLLFPVAIAMANSLNVSYMPFIITLMVAASASFATPIGYQTNLMVYGPGGYHFSDYLRMGLPLTLLIGFACIVIVPIIWPF